MKNNADIKSLFTSADAGLSIDAGRRQETLTLIRAQMKHKEIRLVCSKRQIWLHQLRYADRNMLFAHLLGCALIFILMMLMNARGIGHQLMFETSMILAGILGSFSILEVSRSCFSRFSEISESCFFNISQMTAYDMVFSGLINLAALSAIIVFAGFQWKIRLIQIGLYILVPFIFTQCVCLGVLLTEIGRRNVWLVAAVGGFLSVVYVILASTPRLYTESALFLWAIALLINTAVFAIQIHTLFREIGKGEILCTN